MMESETTPRGRSLLASVSQKLSESTLTLHHQSTEEELKSQKTATVWDYTIRGQKARRGGPNLSKHVAGGQHRKAHLTWWRKTYAAFPKSLKFGLEIVLATCESLLILDTSLLRDQLSMVCGRSTPTRGALASARFVCDGASRARRRS